MFVLKGALIGMVKVRIHVLLTQHHIFKVGDISEYYLDAIVVRSQNEANHAKHQIKRDNES